MNPQTRHVEHKRSLVRKLAALAESSIDDLSRRLEVVYHTDALWRGSHPLNEIKGIDSIAECVWQPLLCAFPDLERRDTIVAAGHYAEQDQVAMLGHLCGRFCRNWLGIPATGRPVFLRYAEIHSVLDGKISRSTVLIDLLDLIRQTGIWPVAPSLGTEGRWPGPLGADGVLLTEQDETISSESIEQTLRLHSTLGGYDDLQNRALGRSGLLNMPQREHWHPKMMWYGPAGIGTTRGFEAFVDHHQLPFRQAFSKRRGSNHYARFGDGPYSVTAGWPSVYGTHTGGAFMGIGPTGRDVQMRVMDFYFHHEGLIRENWVPLDIIHLLLQMDIDVFARLRSLTSTGTEAR